MEPLLREIAEHVALAAELVTVVCVGIGALITLYRAARAALAGALGALDTRRLLFVGFAGWIILALEFALGADIVRTAIAPSWDDIGQLAAIAAIRTFLNFFLERDVEALQEASPSAAEAIRAGTSAGRDGD